MGRQGGLELWRDPGVGDSEEFRTLGSVDLVKLGPPGDSPQCQEATLDFKASTEQHQP